jgi:hypothetical protein
MRSIPRKHNRRPLRHRITSASQVVVAAASALLATTAWAALGGGAASVGADRAALNGQLSTTTMTQYDVHEITSDGLVVREYVTRQGQVFAITWHGPFKPDLRQLLGDYFARYQSAVAAAGDDRAGKHSHSVVSGADLVVQSSGRLRAFQGLAYVPSLVPAGVSVSELQ